jgi:hypothetical protein
MRYHLALPYAASHKACMIRHLIRSDKPVLEVGHDNNQVFEHPCDCSLIVELLTQHALYMDRSEVDAIIADLSRLFALMVFMIDCSQVLLCICLFACVCVCVAVLCDLSNINIRQRAHK